MSNQTAEQLKNQLEQNKEVTTELTTGTEIVTKKLGVDFLDPVYKTYVYGGTPMYVYSENTNANSDMVRDIDTAIANHLTAIKLNYQHENNKITSLHISPDQTTLYIACENGTLVIETMEECCSETWWADIYHINQMINATIKQIETIDLPDPEDQERSRQDFDRAYGLLVKTNLGEGKLVYRNSSNGYYGGDHIMKWTTDPLPDDLIKIEGNDWSN